MKDSECPGNRSVVISGVHWPTHCPDRDGQCGGTGIHIPRHSHGFFAEEEEYGSYDDVYAYEDARYVAVGEHEEVDEHGYYAKDAEYGLYGTSDGEYAELYGSCEDLGEFESECTLLRTMYIFTCSVNICSYVDIHSIGGQLV